jgi:hypothetical protein
MKTFTTKSVEKLLLSLNNDPRLQSLDDTTTLSEEQYPIAFDALIMRIKDPITLTTTVDTINYDDASAQAQSIPAAMRTQLKEKQNKLKNILQLNPTVDNPWDEVTAAHWMHRVTNICLDAAQMALMTVDTSPGMGYLLSELPGKARWHAAQTSTTRHSRQKIRQDGERIVIREMKEANSFFIR